MLLWEDMPPDMKTIARSSSPPEMGFKEFVAVIAALMAMNSLSIDPMLPALPAIGAALHVANPNHPQWVITAYLLGLGTGSLVFGPLSDRFGRKTLTLWSIALFLMATLCCALAPSFAMLLAGRVTAGFFAASSRVISVSIVRDRFEGDRMARIMSLAYMVFMIVPVIAPSFGQAILLIAPWRWIFGVLLVLGSCLFLWILLRLSETLPRERRTAIDPRTIATMLVRVATHRSSIGYMIAGGIVMSGTVAFITSVQQIFADIFHNTGIFPLAFAAISSLMAVGGFANSRLVERIGARRLSHGAVFAMILIALTHIAIIALGVESMASFIVLQALSMLCISLTGSNFGAISMEPFAKGAGLASSFQAFISCVISALLGGAVGAAFNGTAIPLAFGFLLFGLLALAVVAWAERWRLFTRPRHAPLREQADVL